MVALCQAQGGGMEERRWYVSTIELQLTSLEFCRACRSVPIFHVIVDNKTPRRLWDPLVAMPHTKPRRQTPLTPRISGTRAVHGARVIRSRVPVARAACLTWTLVERVLVESGAMLRWGNMESLKLSADVSWSELGSMGWPRTLKRLVLDVSVDVPAQAIVWPANLQELSIGRHFNQPVTSVVWPASLQRLSFGRGLNRSVAGVALPPALQRLSFGKHFNQSVAGVVWPASPQQLSFGDRFNQPIAGIV